jgi:hypothetical protein
MLKTNIIGIGLIVIGLVTTVKFASSNQEVKSLGTMFVFIGAFLLWTAFVANYNSDPSFAIFD